MSQFAKIRAWILVLGVLLCCLPLGALPKKSEFVKAELVSAVKQATPGQTIWLALHLKMSDGWHVYWRNPGTVGFAPSIALTDAKKAQVPTELQWPVPIKANITEIWAYVYEDEVYLPFRYTVPSDAKPGTVHLDGQAKWLACKDSCIPGDAELGIDLKVGDTFEPSEQSKVIEEFKQKVPVPQGLQTRIGAVTGNQLTLEIHSQPLEGAEFFPYKKGVIDDGAPQKFQSDPNGGSLALTVTSKEPVKELKGVVRYKHAGKQESYEISALPGSGPWPNPGADTATVEPEKPSAATQNLTFLGSLWGAFIGGLILNLMPCVFPVLSLKVIGLVEHSDPDQKPYLHGAAFTVGVLISFWLLSGLLFFLKAGGQQLGWGFQFQTPGVVACMAALFFLIALNLFGLFEVGESLTRLGQLAEGKTGYSESFWSGALATVVATPCSAPFLGAAVGYAVALPAWQGMIVFTFVGLGMAAPYVLLTSFPKLMKFLPRPGAWMETFKQSMGFPMLLTVVWFLFILGGQTGVEGMFRMLICLVGLGFAGWILGRWGWDASSSGNRIRAKVACTVIGIGSLAWVLMTLTPVSKAAIGQAVEGEIAWKAYSETEIEAARKAGKKVFIDFTADWCLTCKANERATLKDASVVQLFKDQNVVAFKADWTSSDPVITQALAKFGRSGVPLYVFYSGDKPADVLPEVIRPGILKDLISK